MRPTLRLAAGRAAGTLAALLGLAAPAAAPAAAQSTTLHQSELWKTYTARTAQGQTICGVGTAFENGRQLYVKWFQGTDNLVVQIFKAGWAIPGEVEAPLVFRLDRSPSWTVRTTPLGRVTDFLEFPIVREKVRDFTRDFTASTSMSIDFPGGNEPAWSVSLQGNATAMDVLVRCIQRTAGSADHPYAYLRPSAAPPPLPSASQPMPATTQPFVPQPFLTAPPSRPRDPPPRDPAGVVPEPFVSVPPRP